MQVREIVQPSEITDEMRALVARWVVALPVGVKIDVSALVSALEAVELSDGRHAQFGPQARTALVLHAVAVRRHFLGGTGE